MIKHTEALHDDGVIIIIVMLPENNILLEDHSWRRLSLVKAVVARGDASSNAGASHTSDVMNRLAI